MIFIEHDGNKVTSSAYQGQPLVSSLYALSIENPDEFLLVYKDHKDRDRFLSQAQGIISKTSIISSYNPLNTDFGYVEDKPFIPTNDEVIFPTWKKGTAMFLVHASLLNQVSSQLSSSNNYLYWLNSLGKLTRPLGVLNYQLPITVKTETFGISQLYKFVKQHYKRRWTIHLLLCHLYYEKKFPLYAFAKAQFYKKRSLSLDMLSLQQSLEIIDGTPLNYDVIIPTIGRKEYLKKVLEDLNNQKITPSQVIIIEQNPDPNQISELAYLNNENWNFKIIHKFTHITGACGARNAGIALSNSPWLLFFDDDVRIKTDFMNKVENFIQKTNARCVTFACIQKDEKETMQAYKQWESFGSGCSIVHREIFSQCSFDMALEHGYGEDLDYGMQVRNLGKDVIYAPQIQMLHLKAPVGGFRNPHVFPWKEETVQPKPSPQIMYFRKKNLTLEQLQGYKIMQFFKSFGFFNTKNPYKHFKRFKRAWNQSEKWAARL